MRKGVLTAIGLAVATVGMVAVPVVSAGASSSTQGVTATTIRVGVPYTDFAPVRALGIDINYGNQAHGYEALFAYANAHGGINGRKIVPYIVGVNPVGNAPSQTACTQLTQDDKVFVSISPVVPGCYLLAHVPTINASYPGTVPAGAAQNLSFTPPTTRMTPSSSPSSRRWGHSRAKRSVSTPSRGTRPRRLSCSRLSRNWVSMSSRRQSTLPRTATRSPRTSRPPPSASASRAMA